MEDHGKFRSPWITRISNTDTEHHINTTLTLLPCLRAVAECFNIKLRGYLSSNGADFTQSEHSPDLHKPKAFPKIENFERSFNDRLQFLDAVS
jgi:hypothetical protein